MNPIKKIVIVGGGTSGWIAASVLSNQFGPDVLEVELVESDEIGTIGVGESTIPPFLDMISTLGINEQHFIQSVHATFKLGIKFPDWSQVGETYFHPFGVIGVRVVDRIVLPFLDVLGKRRPLVIVCRRIIRFDVLGEKFSQCARLVLRRLKHD